MTDISYSQALGMALEDAMAQDPSVICLGVGVADPKGIFGTTLGARMRFPGRVIETPLSENALTGACVGLALGGMRPVLVHARMDFLPLTMEHLVNSAAKWEYMTGHPIPMVIRCIVGRGWGQGPTHSQNFAAWVAHVPGLRVFMPYRPIDAYYAMRQALNDSQPTVIVEARRLYGTKGPAPQRRHGESFWGYGLAWSYGPQGKSPDLHIVGIGDALVEANQAGQAIGAQGYSVQVIDCQQYPLRYQQPPAQRWDWFREVHHLVVVDMAPAFCGLSAELIAMAAESGGRDLRVARVTPPAVPCPSGARLEGEWYPSVQDIVSASEALLGALAMPVASSMDHNLTVPSPF